MKELSNKYNKTGVLLINLGTPNSSDVKEVKKYLKEFLSDRRVIEANPIVWKIILTFFILPFRSPKTAALYKSIWRENENMSPLLFYTKSQAYMLQEELGENFIVEYAMRYGMPSIQEKLITLKENGAMNIKVLPLYPQYSATTTATVYDKLYKSLKNMRMQPNIVGIKPYYDHPEYIHILKKSILDHIVSLSYKPDKVLMSFHGLPFEYFEKGDPYYCHCHKTYRLLKDSLSSSLEYPIELSFQSRFGPKKWLGPYTNQVLKDGIKEGFKNIVVVAPGFSADCLETLEELNITEREAFLVNGGDNYSVVPCLNDSKDHILFLKQLVTTVC